MEQKSYLDYAGLSRYNAKVQAEIDKKVTAEPGKGLSTNDFTTAEKEKLEALKNYTLPVSADETLGGVIINSTENPIPSKTALKVDTTGKAFVDWSEAPKASASDAGLIKLGATFKTDPETGAVEVDPSKLDGVGSVSWDDITEKPEIVLKTDLSTVYNYKGSVATYDALPTEDLTAGDVYNVETTGMNYAWTGTAWDALGGSFEINAITNAEIDALFETTET